jgi:soluble lytic murein transglycosylase-like protein
VTTRADSSEGGGDKVATPGPVMPPAPDAHSLYRALIEREARNAGLAPEIAEAVMAVESGYNPAAIGGAGEIGLMQILPSTARMLGFSGTLADLAAPETNIHYGITYLAQAWRLAGQDLCTAVMKYRADTVKHASPTYRSTTAWRCARSSLLAAFGSPVMSRSRPSESRARAAPAVAANASARRGWAT